ncbi:hypothetical protein ASE74_05945 [Pedobacter sp. Leaf216]|uniref:hypothetical protein n=1 Tax=Pedobacter sp. Leaf216 TaxID=1735684 RepID=UPI0006FA7B18|nr:hypothetical protein [Pedobacter sp. Leaf216]KQM69527.1 hypothetical protein ASE74_05945 [Pedobacter sp. Leaf216]
MENYQINIIADKEIHHFKVIEYLHHNGQSCKVKVFQQGKFVAAFEPDPNNFLHICQNPAGLNEELLHLLADKIEAHHPYGIYKDLSEEI